MYEEFLKQIEDFMFIEDKPEKADVIFVPGNGYPQMAEKAAELYRNGFAPKILPSGRYSICLLYTSKRTNGAAAIFLPGVARRLSELLGSDLYLVFTSVHEVMVHNADVVYPEDLKEVLSDTLEKATPEEDYLTSSIYR